jgi:hypothetical protein
MKLEEERLIFYKKWTSSVGHINQQMRTIRKIQNDCNLLHMCFTNKDLLEKVHTGFIFDKIIRNDGMYQYAVYFPEIKMVNRFISRHDKIGLSEQFKLYVFMDENKLKQKIRITIQTLD